MTFEQPREPKLYQHDPFTAAVEQAKQRSGWIKVTPETMPPMGQRVLVCDDNGDIGISEYYDNDMLTGEAMWSFCVGTDYKPTHWMPLPEPAEG